MFDGMKFVVSWRAGGGYCVEDAQQLVRAGGEGDLLGLARGDQSVIERLDDTGLSSQRGSDGMEGQK